jgi:GT2 family glycosyltransferase
MRENDADPLTLLVVHWNNPRACLATVRALRDQYVNLQVAILDNASSPEAYQSLRAEPDAEIIRLPQNLGWGPALNVGLRKWLDQSRGEFCLISAHDAVPSTECVPLLLEAMTRDAKIGIACPQYADATVPTLSALHGVKAHVDLAQNRGVLQFVDVPHGTLFLVRRACLREIGLFDERYFAYGDEHELGARARRHGWKVALVWGATVANPQTSTPSAWRSYLFARNSLLLVHDYFGSVAAFVRASVIAINTLRNSVSPPDKAFAFSARAQWRALRDYFAGRFGPPTIGDE